MAFDANIEPESVDRVSSRISFSSVERYAIVLFGIGLAGLLQSGSDLIAKVGLIALILGAVGIIVGVVASRKHIVHVLERISILGMFVGIVGMLQPWEIRFYEIGFVVVGLSTLAFIAISHVPVKDA